MDNDKLIFSSNWTQMDRFSGSTPYTETSVSAGVNKTVATYTGDIPVFIVQVKIGGRWYLPGYYVNGSNVPRNIKAWAQSGNIMVNSQESGTARVAMLESTI